MSTRSISFVTLTLLLGLASLVGCSEPTPDTYPLAGTVTLDDKPLDHGTMNLVPMDSGSGLPAISIEQGAFSCPVESGPIAGNYRVEITASEKTGRMIEDPDFAGKQTEETRQLIPRRYNVQSTLTLSIPADNAESLKYDLKSR
ncbi:hypothetical protein [Aeoliella mucimassa]|uniref:Carboxypeptidase regulatory-like domain-containing protein n=1 Tax=Aeoliella mucimassa TaxID=2527972 RepID=A0A518AK61_9BACT|nr:hypothetical protein [Aeoliella mucimassa]QDU55076.1 hypothetical protein Pan181_12620 [Aeoliella mucimassa]